jgi:uncharacterized protein (TIGR00251 family)
MGKTTRASQKKCRYPFLHKTSDDTTGVVYIRVQVQPRASGNTVAGVYRKGRKGGKEGEGGGALKIRLTAPPVEGEANKALVVFLSKLLGVKKSRIELKEGKKSRTKMVGIRGVSLREVERIIGKTLDP